MSQDAPNQKSQIANPKSTMEEPWTVRRLRDWTVPFLTKKGVEKPGTEADILLAHALGWERIQLFMRHDEVAPEAARQRFRELVRQRAEGCPIAYLVGRKEFYTLEFEVAPSVLIPRDDTEWIVEECLRLGKEIPEPTVLDLGTGSGCLAVTVARQNKGARVTAVDVSPEALAVATRNAARHEVSDRVTFLEGDLFGPLPPGQRFHFIISNPPYIPTADLAGLERDVRNFEPHLALDGGPDGFAFLDQIITQAPGYLEPGGYLIVEIGITQETPARERISRVSGYALGKTVHDLAGHPRVLCARWLPEAGSNERV
jgi:release factor glutamine methyltransferase